MKTQGTNRFSIAESEIIGPTSTGPTPRMLTDIKALKNLYKDKDLYKKRSDSIADNLLVSRLDADPFVGFKERVELLAMQEPSRVSLEKTTDRGQTFDPDAMNFEFNDDSPNGHGLDYELRKKINSDPIGVLEVYLDKVDLLLMRVKNQTRKEEDHDELDEFGELDLDKYISRLDEKARVSKKGNSQQ